MCLGRGGERCLSYYVQSRGHEVCPGVHGVCVSWVMCVPGSVGCVCPGVYEGEWGIWGVSWDTWGVSRGPWGVCVLGYTRGCGVYGVCPRTHRVCPQGPWGVCVLGYMRGCEVYEVCPGTHGVCPGVHVVCVSWGT